MNVVNVDPTDRPSLSTLADEARITTARAVSMLELDPDTATDEPLRPRVAAVYRLVLASQIENEGRA